MMSRLQEGGIMRPKIPAFMAAALAATLLACGQTQQTEQNAGDPAGAAASGETPAALVINNARIIDGNGSVIERGSVVVRDGRIVSVGEQAGALEDAQTIDAQGLTVM